LPVAELRLPIGRNKIENRKSKTENRIDCSVVVPLYNEADVVDELYTRLTSSMGLTGLDYELVLVDDGSDDNQDKLVIQAG